MYSTLLEMGRRNSILSTMRFEVYSFVLMKMQVTWDGVNW